MMNESNPGQIPEATANTRAVASMPAQLRVRVHLVDSDPEIWRLLELDANLHLDAVHTALQTVMGWENSHLHTFTDADPELMFRRRDWNHTERRWGSAFLREEDDDDTMLPEEDIPLRDVLTMDSPLFYEYDLGDSWIHRIDLIETLPHTPSDPTVTVIRGERRCPLEDSGGIHGYHELLDILADPAHPEHPDKLDWVEWIHGDTPFDPAAFDIDAVNASLSHQFPNVL
jgi:hypothetical protein